MHYLGRLCASRKMKGLLVECTDRLPFKLIDQALRIGVKIHHDSSGEWYVGATSNSWLFSDLIPIGRIDPRRFKYALPG